MSSDGQGPFEDPDWPASAAPYLDAEIGPCGVGPCRDQSAGYVEIAPGMPIGLCKRHKAEAAFRGAHVQTVNIEHE